MTDLTKVKLQLRTGISRSSPDRTPTPPAKLMINHGKPNFTLPRSIIKQNGTYNGTTTSPERHLINNNNNNNNNNNSIDNKNYKTKPVVKSSTFYGVTRPAIQSSSNTNEENEVYKVVLRRTKQPEVPFKAHNNNDNNDNDNDDNVPEFIKRQRRIQERLAKENILDFENRRSGYFTQCMLSPTTNNRQSFSPTMASPAIVPAFEMDTPSTPKVITSKITTTITTTATAAATTTTTNTNNNNNNNNNCNGKLENCLQMKSEKKSDTNDGDEVKNKEISSCTAPELMNGNCAEHEKCLIKEQYKNVQAAAAAEEEEEEVAKAIEEVNKAVEGEDDDNNKYENVENYEDTYEIKRNDIEKEIELIIAKAAAAVIQKQKSSNNNGANNKLENGHIKYMENDSIMAISNANDASHSIDLDATKAMNND